MSDYPLGIDQIQKYLPHRAPFLLIDRVLEIETPHVVNALTTTTAVGIKVIAEKLVSGNEYWVPGHFPGRPIMPGVLIVEAMAQAASMTLYPFVCDQLDSFTKDFQVMLTGTDAVRFRRAVVPGDVLRLESVVTRCRGKVWVFHCEARVEGQLAAEGDMMALMSGSDLVFSMGVS